MENNLLLVTLATCCSFCYLAYLSGYILPIVNVDVATQHLVLVEISWEMHDCMCVFLHMHV